MLRHPANFDRSSTYSSVPDIEAPKDDMVVFLCCCLLSKPVDAAIRDWAASPEGHSSYTHLKEQLYDQESGERTILTLLALLSFQMLHPCCPSCIDEKQGLVNVCHFWSFSVHLDGGKLASRDTLRQMARSLWVLVSGGCCSRTSHFFDMIDAGPPKHLLDALSDSYWWHKIMKKCDHRDAWTSTWDQTEVDIVNAEIIISHKEG